MSGRVAKESAPPLKYADPTALGLFGLAIACAALLPVSFGVKSAMTPDALETTAVLCLLFGGGCQMIAGLLSFANKNLLGGTLMTAFSFNWVVNAWSLDGLAHGHVPGASVMLSVDVCFLAIFLGMTYAFGFHSKLLVAFLGVIDAIYVMRIVREIASTQALALPMAGATVALMGIALYVAIALVLAGASGKVVLPIGGPAWGAARPAHG
ncbi:MAG: hypothetical protein U0414_08265 [Polyangiaceae bacterium]